MDRASEMFWAPAIMAASLLTKASLSIAGMSVVTAMKASQDPLRKKRSPSAPLRSQIFSQNNKKARTRGKSPAAAAAGKPPSETPADKSMNLSNGIGVNALGGMSILKFAACAFRRQKSKRRQGNPYRFFLWPLFPRDSCRLRAQGSSTQIARRKSAPKSRRNAKRRVRSGS